MEKTKEQLEEEITESLNEMIQLAIKTCGLITSYRCHYVDPDTIINSLIDAHGSGISTTEDMILFIRKNLHDLFDLNNNLWKK